MRLIIGVLENVSADAAGAPAFTHVCLLSGAVSSPPSPPAGYVTFQAHVNWVHKVISIHYTALCLSKRHCHSLREQGRARAVFATGISEGHFRGLPSSAQS